VEENKLDFCLNLVSSKSGNVNEVNLEFFISENLEGKNSFNGRDVM